ncbi:MAG: hypothetical protein ACUVQP_12905, partial [Bacteroidales bacterium]
RAKGEFDCYLVIVSCNQRAKGEFDCYLLLCRCIEIKIQKFYSRMQPGIKSLFPKFIRFFIFNKC